MGAQVAGPAARGGGGGRGPTANLHGPLQQPRMEREAAGEGEEGGWSAARLPVASLPLTQRGFSNVKA